jgi:DNA-directed RNA polymerase specialized sigma24 family protein
MTMSKIQPLPAVKAGQTLHDIPDPDGDVYERVIERIDAARIRRHVRALPALEQRVITWKYGIGGVEPLSCRQIARRLGVSTGTAWNIEQRALAILRASVGDSLTDAA